jgi:predicted double-glycine peptidase
MSAPKAVVGFLGGLLALAVSGCAQPEGENTTHKLVHHQGHTWIETRFSNMISQKNDYTCGAASLATMFTHYYGLSVSESDILEMSDRKRANKFTLREDAEATKIKNAKKEDLQIQGFTFQDLASFANKLGFSTKGLKTNYESLQNIKIPVVAYLEGHGFNHFVVIRQVTDEWIYVADPTWGNRRYLRGRFKELWAIDRGADGTRLGRILAILPGEKKEEVQTDSGFFNPI